ncbi:zinc finger CCHC domain-containing protein 8 [Arapaima gigas]
MAEVDFGDSELFQQFEEDAHSHTCMQRAGDGEAPEELLALRERLDEYEETICKLKAENILILRRKLNILTRPSGITIENSRLDGPLLQILFANNDISKQCRQEVEDCIFGLIKKHEQQPKGEKEHSSFHVKPQTSSFVLEENHDVNRSSTIRKIKDAFTVVGSVLYFTSFCLDNIGQPLLNENPQLTDGWEIPKYQQVFGQVMSLDGQEVQMKEKRPKPCCFNCGSEDHQLKDCPKPRDMARINEKRKEFSQGNSQSNQRYHAEEVEERFMKYKPGIVSAELLDALGVAENSLPPFIYRMRQLGYPPGWLKEAEMENSGLTLYDGKVSNDGENSEDQRFQSHRISYDLSKLVDFPGFNVSAPANINDEWRSYGSVPMQSIHLKQNYAAYLSNTFPVPVATSNKRAHEFESTPRHTKKRRSDDTARCSDMDLDSGSETPHSSRSPDKFQFQPPLPPGSPGLDTPPPLPRGTPPATPTPPPLPRSTPSVTPNNSSPALQDRTGAEEPGEEDGLTLEELEEQQRLIWAALASADISTNSDSETPAAGTSVVSSSGASTPAQVDTEMEVEDEEEEVEQAKMSGAEERLDYSIDKDLVSVAECNEGLEANDVVEEGDREAEACEKDLDKDADELQNMQVSTENLLPPDKAPAGDTDVISGPDPNNFSCQDPLEQVQKVTTVPHRSKFAEGIIPFEDTPEYKDVAEATGVYLRIRDLLKSSPRNQVKNKK